MKILAVAQYGSLTGGANRSLLMVLERLKNVYGYEIKVLVPQEGRLCEELNKVQIPYEVLKFHQISGVESNSYKNKLRLLRFRLWAALDRINAIKYAKHARKEQYDLVYINDTNHYVGCYIAEALSIPYIWHFRSTIYPNTIFLQESKRLYREAEKIIAISRGMKKLLSECEFLSSDKIECVLNGVPLEKQALVSRQNRQNGFHFVECGRITSDKGHKDAIRAISILKKRGIKDVYLHIVGEVPGSVYTSYFNELTRLVEQLNIFDNVIFEGGCNDMLHFREKMHGELVCSVCEPFGRVTVEGMRSGLLVIGSNTGGTPEIIIDGHTGLLYEQGNPEDLANKIQMVYQDTNLRNHIIKNALEYSKMYFTPEQNVAEIKRIMQNVIEGIN